MFVIFWLEEVKEVDLVVDVCVVFDVLCECLVVIREWLDDDFLDLDVMFVWLFIYGIVSVVESEVMKYLNFNEEKVGCVVMYVV